VEGQVTKASASAAQLQTTDQLISVPGTTVVESTDGLKGTLDMVFLDAMNWTLAAGGKVDMTLPDGTHILADSMTYERNAQHYTFRNVTLELPMTPGESQ
jgi:lipopolysaccharide assembly outer membrane protein LptD (OstA)